jgi:hypothetical protein
MKTACLAWFITRQHARSSWHSKTPFSFWRTCSTPARASRDPHVDFDDNEESEITKMANDRLAAVVQCTTRIQLMTEGGWQYSSPIVRESGGPEIPLLDVPDAISIVSLMVGDIDMLARELSCLAEESRTLGIDSVAMCQVDLPSLALAYQQLAMDLGSAAQRAVDAMRQPAKPERRRRANSKQTSLLPDETESPES